jgi:hypothetical protein
VTEQLVLYTEDEAAEIMRLSPRTLQQWRLRGRGPRYHKLGKRCLYTMKALVAFVQANERQSTSEKKP